MFQLVIKLSCALVLLLSGANALAAGDAEAGQAKAATCVACHGVDGNSAVPTFPKLAGIGHKYLLKQMKDIRDGRRPVRERQVPSADAPVPRVAAALRRPPPRRARPRARLAERAAEGSRPGARREGDAKKIALAIEGGGMRGCIAGGMVTALWHLGLADAVDVVYGSSAGSLVGAYFIARQMPHDGPEVRRRPRAPTTAPLRRLGRRS